MTCRPKPGVGRDQGLHHQPHQPDRGVVIGAYHQLWRIEKSFRMSKHDLQARPTDHDKRESIEAHLSIVFAALAVSHWIEHQTGRSIKKFVQTLRRYRTVTIRAGNHTLTAAAPLPADIQDVLATITTAAEAPSDLGRSGTAAEGTHEIVLTRDIGHDSYVSPSRSLQKPTVFLKCPWSNWVHHVAPLLTRGCIRWSSRSRQCGRRGDTSTARGAISRWTDGLEPAAGAPPAGSLRLGGSSGTRRSPKVLRNLGHPSVMIRHVITRLSRNAKSELFGPPGHQYRRISRVELRRGSAAGC